MSTHPTGLGYPGGRSGNFSSSRMENHAFRGTSALINTFGGGVNGSPTPGRYAGLGYPGGRSGNFSGMENHAFRGSTGIGSALGQAASSNLVLTGLGIVVIAVVFEGFRTRRIITGIKPVDKLVKDVAKAISPITSPIADIVGA
jgi:hypothetical protein